MIRRAVKFTSLAGRTVSSSSRFRELIPWQAQQESYSVGQSVFFLHTCSKSNQKLLRGYLAADHRPSDPLKDENTGYQRLRLGLLPGASSDR